MKNLLCLISLLSMLSSSACIPLWWGETDEGPEPLIQDPAWAEYLEHVKAQPLDFLIPSVEDAEAWTRAHEILKEYGRHTRWCPSKLLISTANIIEIDVQGKFTFKEIGFLFRIVRAPREDTTKYTITYAPTERPHSYPEIKAHAQVIAYYIVSGRFMKYVWSGGQFDVRAHDWDAM